MHKAWSGLHKTVHRLLMKNREAVYMVKTVREHTQPLRTAHHKRADFSTNMCAHFYYAITN